MAAEGLQGDPLPPVQYVTGVSGAAPPPTFPMGSSGTAQGGMPSGLQAGMGQPTPGTPLIRSDQSQPQSTGQPQNPPAVAKPGAKGAFDLAKGQSMKAPSAGLPKAPAAGVPKATPRTVTASLYPLKVAMLAPPRKVASHTFGFPTTPPPVGQMPESPATQLGSIMDLARPLRHPIASASNFISGLGNEADRQLTQSMIAQPITIHQQQYQQHPAVTN